MVAIFLEQMSYDLGNAFPYASASFIGAKSYVEFYTAAGQDPGLLGVTRQQSRQPTKIRYGFDQGSSELIRKAISYISLLYPNEDVSNPIRKLKGILRCEMMYYDANPDAKGSYWRSRWNKDCLPKAIKINLQYRARHKGDIVKIIPLHSGICKRVSA